jgi:indolepyruvate decarboxylase
MFAPFTVADYLLGRLAEVGVRHLFGVPGDFNLAFLDHVIAHPQITWVGNANELNAAYAADGYARLNGMGALLTTFGVGELSAINGVAGSYAEYVPVIHVVGAPSTAARREKALIHHTLGDGDFDRFARAHAEVTVAQTTLTRENAATEIDRVIATARRERRPGYLVLPLDVAASPIDPPVQALDEGTPERSQLALDAFRAQASEMLANAGSAVVLADFLADRFGVQSSLQTLLDRGVFPYATMSMGKGLLDETDPRFLGIFAGAAGALPVRDTFAGADVVIAAGVQFYDSTTAGFTHNLAAERLIDIQPFATRIGKQLYAPLPMRDALDALSALVVSLGRSWSQPVQRVADPVLGSGAHLQQTELWAELERFLRPGDVLVADQGTAYYGAATLRLPRDVRFIGQALWASIGYALPAAFGAQTAAPDRRVVLLIGDGGALMTAQEIGSMLRDGQRPIVVLINNDGYTIERAIHGPEERYNDIPRWDWSLLPKAMGAGNDTMMLQARSAAELRSALATAATSDRFVLLEATLPKHDLPAFLATLIQAFTRRNAA